MKPRWWFALLTLFGCAPKFVDTTTPAGVPNLDEFAPHMWRMGQPPDEAGWRELAVRIAPNGERVVVFKLNDEKEGDDSPAEKVLGWQVVRIPLPPEDDKPWTIFLKPNPQDIQGGVQAAIDAHNRGFVVVWHCTHGRDRTSLFSALVGRKMFAWTKDYAWEDMLKHGFRWELPDLAAYWIEDVPATKR